MGSSYTALSGVHVTINQIVAYNLARFRKASDLTQEQLGEMLRWSKVVVSAAERSWDGKRVRQFSADDVLSIAMVLDIPISALFLPPEDDGVDRRYLFHLSDGKGPICHNMYDLFTFLSSEPPYDDEPATLAYRQRYIAAENLYLDPGRGDELAQTLDDLTTEERIVNRLGRLQEQYDALRGVLGDIDKLHEALSRRLDDVRSERPGEVRAAEARKLAERAERARVEADAQRLLGHRPANQAEWDKALGLVREERQRSSREPGTQDPLRRGEPEPKQ